MKIIIIIINGVFHTSVSCSEEQVDDGSQDHRTPSQLPLKEGWSKWDLEKGSKTGQSIYR
jgi:hypothetical protein